MKSRPVAPQYVQIALKTKKNPVTMAISSAMTAVLLSANLRRDGHVQLQGKTALLSVEMDWSFLLSNVTQGRILAVFLTARLLSLGGTVRRGTLQFVSKLAWL